MITKYLKNILKNSEFYPSIISMIFNPVYILRSRLFLGINAIARLIPGRILDVGCGIKPYENLFVNSTSYIGIDVEVSGHDHADSKVDYFYDGKSFPFKDNSFDNIVCFEVFEHVFNIDELLNEISRVLKPEGGLLISVPFIWEEHEQPYDYARYTFYGLSHLLNKHNFEVVKSIKTGSYFLSLCQLNINYLSKTFSSSHYIFYYLFQVFLIFPLTLFSILLSKISNKTDEFYMNNIIYSKKRNED